MQTHKSEQKIKSTKHKHSRFCAICIRLLTSACVWGAWRVRLFGCRARRGAVGRVCSLVRCPSKEVVLKGVVRGDALHRVVLKHVQNEILKLEVVRQWMPQFVEPSATGAPCLNP